MSSADTRPPAGSADGKLSPKPLRVRRVSSSDLHPVKGPGLTEKEKHHDERIRTLCFVMMACAVLYYLVLTLRDVLVPFFLALAIKYVLTPLINVLSCRHRAHEDTAGQCSWRLHRGFAIFVAMMLAAGMLSVLGILIVRSVAVFASNAGTYSHRLAEIVEEVFAFVDDMESRMHHRSGNISSEGGARSVGSGMRFLQSQLDTVDLGVLISLFLDHAAEVRHSLRAVVLQVSTRSTGHSTTSKYSMPRRHERASNNSLHPIHLQLTYLLWMMSLLWLENMICILLLNTAWLYLLWLCTKGREPPPGSPPLMRMACL